MINWLASPFRAGLFGAGDKAKLDLISSAPETTVSTGIVAATAKTTPVDADSIGIVDSAASNVLKKVTWANVKATLKTYLDTLYPAIGHSHAWSAITGRPDALVSVGGLTPAADKVPYYTGASTAALADLTAYGRSINAVADEAAFKALVNLEPGTDVQPYDADTAKTDVDQSWTGAQRFGAPTAITSGTTLTILLADGNDFTLTLAHDGTLANPADIASFVGQKGSIAGEQDGTGGRTLAVGNQWFPIGSATIPAIPTGANDKWRLDYHVVSATRIDFAVAGVGV